MGVEVRALPAKMKCFDPKPSPGWGCLPEDALHHQATGQAAVKREAISILSNGSWIWWKETTLDPSAPGQGDLLLGYSCTGVPWGQRGAQSPAVLQAGSTRKALLVKQKWTCTFWETLNHTDSSNIPVLSTDIRSKWITCSCGSQISPLCWKRVQTWLTNSSKAH